MFILRRQGISVPRTSLHEVSLPAIVLVVVFINPWKSRACLEPGFVVCSGRGFEAAPSAGSRGRCEPSLGDELCQESTQTQFQTKPVASKGQSQGKMSGFRGTSPVHFARQFSWSYPTRHNQNHQLSVCWALLQAFLCCIFY